jgi:hypothetical protein
MSIYLTIMILPLLFKNIAQWFYIFTVICSPCSWKLDGFLNLKIAWELNSLSVCKFKWHISVTFWWYFHEHNRLLNAMWHRKNLLTIQSIKLLQKSVNLYETLLCHIPRDGSAYARCHHCLIAYETSKATVTFEIIRGKLFLILVNIFFSPSDDTLPCWDNHSHSYLRNFNLCYYRDDKGTSF